MKSKNNFWAKLAIKFSWLTTFSAQKQANRKEEALAESVVEKRTPAYKPLILLVPTLLVITAFTLVPFIINIIQSFTVQNAKNGVLHNFESLFKEPKFAVGVRNSILYAIVVLPFVMMVSLLISSCIVNVYRKWARGFWQTIFFLPYITNIVAVSLSFIQFFENNGLFNTIFNLGEIPWLNDKSPKAIISFYPFLAMVVQGIWSGLAFNVLIFTTAMLSVDKNLYKSASIDGIGPVKQFFTITLPSIKSTTTFLVTMGIINGIKVFPLALFNNRPEEAVLKGASTLMIFVYYYTSLGGAENLSLAAAGSILLFIIGIVYSTIIRGGFGTIMRVSLNLGESNVWNKIKDSEVMIKYQNKKKQRQNSATS